MRGIDLSFHAGIRLAVNVLTAPFVALLLCVGATIGFILVLAALDGALAGSASVVFDFYRSAVTLHKEFSLLIRVAEGVLIVVGLAKVRDEWQYQNRRR